MLNIPSKGELGALMEQQTFPCITMFLSTHRAGVETQSDPLKLRHAIREAEHNLLLGDLRASAVEHLLEPMRALVEDEQFWRHPGDGLVILRSSHVFRVYRLPIQVIDRVVVSNHFMLKPLLPLLNDDGRFYILALSQNDVRLLECTHYSIEEIKLPKAVPQSLDEALKYEHARSNQLRRHSSSSGALVGKGGRRASIFHGQGVGIDDSKDHLVHYFQQINRGLHELFRDETAPLVLAGVEYLFPMYRASNTYPHLLEQGIAGNPDKLKAETLSEWAWAIIQPYVLKPQREAAARYKDAVGTELASNMLSEILPAANSGRVESLFVAIDQEQWGSFDAATNALQLHQEAEAGDVDLLDVAATQTFLHAGAVYALNWTEVPGEAWAAAVFRY